MNLIYKYPILRIKRQQVELPCDSQILSFNNQTNDMFIWVSINTENPKKIINFTIAGTGHEVPEGKYIGTVIMPDGYVRHLYQDEE